MHKYQERDGEEDRISTRCKDSHNRYMESVGLNVEKYWTGQRRRKKLKTTTATPDDGKNPRRTMYHRTRALRDTTSPLYILEGLCDHSEWLPHMEPEVGLKERETEVPLSDASRLDHARVGDPHSILYGFVTLLDGSQSYLHGHTCL